MLKNKEVFNPKMVIAAGDKFMDRTVDRTKGSDKKHARRYVVLSDRPLSGRFATESLDPDGNPLDFCMIDVTDFRVFKRDIARPDVPNIPSVILYLTNEGLVTFMGDTKGIIAKHDVIEGTWRYLDEEVIENIGWT
jgi:hypothetical protein